MLDPQKLKVEGYVGSWGEIDRKEINNTVYLLLEHNTYGDETCGLVITLPSDSSISHIPEENIICETFDGLEQALTDEGII